MIAPTFQPRLNTVLCLHTKRTPPQLGGFPLEALENETERESIWLTHAVIFMRRFPKSAHLFILILGDERLPNLPSLPFPLLQIALWMGLAVG